MKLRGAKRGVNQFDIYLSFSVKSQIARTKNDNRLYNDDFHYTLNTLVFDSGCFSPYLIKMMMLLMGYRQVHFIPYTHIIDGKTEKTDKNSMIQ